MGRGKPSVRSVSSPLDQAGGHEVIWNNVQPLFEAARGLKDLSFVYFVGEEDEGPIKIGVAKDPIRRLWSMKAGNPRHMRIEHVVLGTGREEKLFHELWEPLAIRSFKNRKNPNSAPGTEWFAPEIRPKLFPIVQEIADTQVCLIEESRIDDLYELTLEAHSMHGVEPSQDKVRVPRRGGDYAELRA